MMSSSSSSSAESLTAAAEALNADKAKTKSPSAAPLLSEPEPSPHNPHFGPLVPDPVTRRLPVSPSDTKNFEDLYPERRGRQVEYTAWQILSGKGNEASNKRLCEENVVECVERMPMVRHALGALRSSGCSVDLDRHFSCEVCKPGRDLATSYGGYDERNNQVFVCANNARNVGTVHGALVRGLLSMFDACAVERDPRSVDHLACTEVRRANLANCQLGVYWCRKDADFAVKARHEDCVRKTAVEAMVKARFVEEGAAREAVDRVFNRCYRDMEPFGRRAKNAKDIEMANSERYLAGYQ